MSSGYAADDVTHCIRPEDVKSRRAVVILRRSTFYLLAGLLYYVTASSRGALIDDMIHLSVPWLQLNTYLLLLLFINRLTYALPAYAGQLTADDKNGINAISRKAM